VHMCFLVINIHHIHVTCTLQEKFTIISLYKHLSDCYYVADEISEYLAAVVESNCSLKC